MDIASGQFCGILAQTPPGGRHDPGSAPIPDIQNLPFLRYPRSGSLQNVLPLAPKTPIKGVRAHRAGLPSLTCPAKKPQRGGGPGAVAYREKCRSETASDSRQNKVVKTFNAYDIPAKEVLPEPLKKRQQPRLRSGISLLNTSGPGRTSRRRQPAE